MTNIIQQLENEQLDKIVAQREVPNSTQVIPFVYT